ncbi:hypothetical protein Scep_021712 [Stephania cephalantha]|uniref:MADS-box domain-containing protein n=1 Tax=Stephania cephalantha TaxID=152367 RepID=A0AAP0F918_9MAGN
MANKKIKIRKMDKTTTRQVTFSKRGRGIVKNAEEISILCDPKVNSFDSCDEEHEELEFS